MPRILTNLKIDEISAVDRGAGEGVRIMLTKRDGTPDYQRVFNKIFGVRDWRPRRKADVAADLARQMDTDADAPLDVGNRRDTAPKHPLDIATDDGGDDSDASPTTRAAKHLDDLAALLVTSAKGQLSKADALHWLLFTAPGRTFVTRHAALHKRRKDQTTMKSHLELSNDVIKQYGLTAFCKSVQSGTVRVGDTEFVQLVSKEAERRGTTFEKVYSEPDVWKADQARRNANWVKAGTLATSGSKLTPATLQPNIVNVTIDQTDNPRAALKAIQDLVAEQRRRAPELTEAGAWDAVYSNPKNATAVAAERAESRGLLPTVGGR
jgi:hypothetical protein